MPEFPLELEMAMATLQVAVAAAMVMVIAVAVALTAAVVKISAIARLMMVKGSAQVGGGGRPRHTLEDSLLWYVRTSC